MNLDAPWTQANFGDLVGIGQPAVSDLIARNVLQTGQTARQWLDAYCSHLREMAAGRGMDGELAYQRAEAARVSRERNEIKLALERNTFAPVPLLEQVLATVGRKIAGLLEPLPGRLHKLCPALTPDDVVLIQRELAQACDVAAMASLSVLDEPEEGAAPVVEADAEPDDFEDELGGGL